MAIRILSFYFHLLVCRNIRWIRKFERDFSTWCWVSIWWMATVMRWIETIIKPFDGWKKHSNISRSTAMKVRRKQIKYWDNPIFLLPASFFDWYKPKRSTVNQQPVPFVFTCHYLASRSIFQLHFNHFFGFGVLFHVEQSSSLWIECPRLSDQAQTFSFLVTTKCENLKSLWLQQ